jgi:hypothetical protein
MKPPFLPVIGSVFCLAAIPVARAQYPQVPAARQAPVTAAKDAADRRSDEIFASQKSTLEAWAQKGKPYIPWAAKPTDLPQATIPAFPGAQGGGMYSFGGRGGRVIVVSTLDDSGPGSFREALESAGPRIVVFNVAGIIHLKDRIRVRAPYITIAGSTAPGDGVCIAGNTVELETHDVIVRHMRFRRGATDPADRNDSFGGNPVGNIMIDHVSASWGLDEDMSIYRHMYTPPGADKELKLPTVNITIQNSIFSEALNTFHHAFGSTIGGYNSTFHHNLWASNSGRNPSVGMIYDFTFVNNVVFNWRHRTTDGGDHRSFYTIINNYYKPGPATPKDQPISHRILKPEARRAKPPVDEFGKAYVHGNVVEGNKTVTADNWAGGVQIFDRGDEPKGTTPERIQELLDGIRADKPYPHAYLEIQSAEDAYKTVLATAGATLPKRDPVDARVVESVRTGEVTAKAGPDDAKDMAGVKFQQSLIDELIEDVAKGHITNPSQVGGYPEYSGKPYKDTDGDGLPDDWETKYGLNPNDPSDATADANHDGYVNIEEFINRFDPTAAKPAWKAPQGYVDLWKDTKL